jgi:hypothetical protein
MACEILQYAAQIDQLKLVMGEYSAFSKKWQEKCVSWATKKKEEALCLCKQHCSSKMWS